MKNMKEKQVKEDKRSTFSIWNYRLGIVPEIDTPSKEKISAFLDKQVPDTNSKLKILSTPLARAKFEQSQLESTASTLPRIEECQKRIRRAFWDPQTSIKRWGSLPLLLYSEGPVVCPYCGHLDIVPHVFFKDRRWKCRNCGKTFSWGVDKGLHSPFKLWNIILSSFQQGDDFPRINLELEMQAPGKGFPEIKSISPDAVYSIVERTNLVLANFEPIAIRKLASKEIKLGTLEMDYSPYPIYTMGKRIKQQDLINNRNINFHNIIENLCRKKMEDMTARNEKVDYHSVIEMIDKKELKRLGIGIKRFAYITGSLVVESRYPPPMVTSFSFDYKRSLKCLENAITTFGCKPRRILCDGGGRGVHCKAVNMMVPDVELYSRTKAQCYNIVNHQERYWMEIKDECLRPYRFMSLRTLSLGVEFKRFQHIYLRPHLSLGGKTPAEHIGILLPKSITRNVGEKWQRLLEFAYKVIMLEKCGDLRDFFKE